jgi:CubicO group peptidase (beta-lactamase class C family)
LTTLRRQLACLFCVLALSSVALRAIAGDAPPADLDAYVARAMRTFNVPGVAIAIVKDGRVVLQKGYGVRKLGDPTPVDAHTLFAIGSNTKAFTAAAMATLVDAGKLSWDDPVDQRLRGFQMYDPYVSKEMRIRDLLCHRSGLGIGEGDLMLFNTTLTRDQVVDRARYLKPISSFRTTFAYSNLMFVVAGQVIAKVSGQSWDDYVRRAIFVPLGMKETNTGTDGFHAGADWASPHSYRGGRLRPVEFSNLETAAAAGAINSSVADMSRWMLLQLDGGRIPGSDRRIFSRKSSEEMWTQESVVPLNWYGEYVDGLVPQFSGYGMGWFLRDYKGRELIGHPGGVTGFVSRVMLVPREHLGVVILTNAEEGSILDAVLYHILDGYLGGSTQDYIAAYKAAEEKGDQAAAATMAKARRTRTVDSRPPLPLERYAGDYADPWYGKVTIRLVDGTLRLDFLQTTSGTADLQQWQYDTFKARWHDRLKEDAFVTFTLKPDGAIDHFTMQSVSPLADFSFDYQDLYFTPMTAGEKR